VYKRLVQNARLACLRHGIEWSSYACLSTLRTNPNSSKFSGGALLAVGRSLFSFRCSHQAVQLVLSSAFSSSTFPSNSISTKQSTMAQTNKGKPPAASTAAPGDEGKQSLNQSAPDFPRMVNMMAGSGFFQQWPGAMTFYNHPDNAFWSDRYSKSTFANGWATAKKKNLENLQCRPVQEDACEFLSVAVLLFGTVIFCRSNLDSSTHSDSFLFICSRWHQSK